MKYLTFIILITVKIGIGQSFPLTLYNVPEFKTCEEAKEYAELNFSNNNMVWSRSGALDYFKKDYPKGFVQFYETYFYAKYNIKFFMRSEDCMTSPEQYCYAKNMDSIILKKYGKDFFKKEQLKIEKIFKNSNLDECSNIIDFNKAYSYLDSPPKFIGNDRTLKNYLKEKFKTSLAEEIPNFDTITLIIDSKGKIIDYKINSSKIQHKTKIQIILELNSLGNWVPGYLYNQKVNSEREFIDLHEE